MMVYTTSTLTTYWRDALPVLTGELATLRELEVGDAAALAEHVGAPEVARFMSPPPATVEGFERFIQWARQERQRGRYICLGVVPRGMRTPVGLFFIKRLDPEFGIAEWGFALASQFWGTGVFAECAELVLDFAFDVVGVVRMEARVAAVNGRGNGAMRKLGAVQEAVLRKSFLCDGQYIDQALWSIVAADRIERRAARRTWVH